MTIKELLEQRAELAKTIRQLADKANNEKRDFTAEEKANWEKANSDYDGLTRQIDIANRAASVAATMEAAATTATPATPGREDIDSRANANPNAPTFEDEALSIQALGLRNKGARLITDKHRAAAQRCGVDLDANENGFRFGATLSKRAIGDAPQTVTTTAGGYLVPPGSIAAAIERAMLYYNPLDGIATQVVTGSGEPMFFPTVNDTTSAGEMVAINSLVTEGAITFGQVRLDAYKGSSKSVLIPYELFQDSAFNMMSFLAETLGERLGRLRAAQLTTGTGSTAPNGIVTASTAGVTTASQTACTADELLGLMHSVNPAYRNDPSCAWMMNDTQLLALRKLKDGQGRYLWEPSMLAGVPDTIWGKKVVINPAMADPAHSAKPILFGAFRKFLVRTVGEIRIIVDPYTYATKDQTLVVAFIRFDSDLLDAGTNPVKHLANA